ncbi:MAG: hypothetical protein ABUT39_02305 [Acidobacteriota bacterium]
MARLIVEAASDEGGVDEVHEIMLLVSVSRADTGEPVTGLTAENFRVTSSAWGGMDYYHAVIKETKWDKDDIELSGCYLLSVKPYNPNLGKYIKGEHYSFGVQVRTFRGDVASDFGQTVIGLESLGT